MPDIIPFDQVEDDSIENSAVIPFDQVEEDAPATSVPEAPFQRPSDLSVYLNAIKDVALEAPGNIWEGVKKTPAAVGQLVSDIPTGISNLYHLPEDLGGVGNDALRLALNSVLGTDFKPNGTTDYQRTERTLKGIASLGLSGAGALVAGPAGAAAGNKALDDVLESVGVSPQTNPDNDLKKLEQDTGTFAALSTVLSGAGKVASVGSDIIRPLTVAEEQIQSLGVPTLAQLKRANQFKPTIDGETPLDQALTGATERGVFGVGESDPVSIGQRNTAAAEQIAEELHGQNGVLAQADAAQTNVEIPKLTSVDKFFENTLPTEALKNQLQGRLELLNQLWDGTISGLSKFKSRLGNGAFRTLTESKGLDQALYNDLKKSVENQAEKAVLGLGDKVKALNSDLSEHYILKPLIEKAELKAEQADLKPAEPGIIKSAAKGFGKGLTAGLIGEAAGFHGSAIGAGAGLAAFEGGKAVLRTPIAQALGKLGINATAGTLDAASSGLDAASKVVPLLNAIDGGSKKEVTPQLRKALSNVLGEKKMDAKVNESFVNEKEGGQKFKAYNPPDEGSGITVATGIDLGQHSRKELEDLGVSNSIINKVEKYLGKKDEVAKNLLKENPLTLKKDEADELDKAIHNDIYDTVESKLKDKGVDFNKLPVEAQSVIKSISLNFGKNFDESLPTLWKAITEKDWVKVQNLLINTKWKQSKLMTRRRQEAELLDAIV